MAAEFVLDVYAKQAVRSGIMFDKHHVSQAQRGKRAKAAANAPTASTSSQLSFGKDTRLALFHALGKILYNKRLDPSLDGEAPLADPNDPSLAPAGLPGACQAMLMPSSSKQCQVADRYARRCCRF